MPSSAADPNEPPVALYALAGLAMVLHAGVVLLLLVGVVVFTIAFGFVIMIITLGTVRSIFLEGWALIWPPRQFFWMLVALASVKPVALVLTVLALRSVRWAQVSLSVAVGSLVLLDLTGAGYSLFRQASDPRGAILLIVVAGAELFLLWHLEGKRLFRATYSG